MNIVDIKNLNDNKKKYSLTVLQFLDPNDETAKKSFWQVKIDYQNTIHFLLTMRNTIRCFRSLDTVFDFIVNDCKKASDIKIVTVNNQKYSIRREPNEI